MYLYVFVCGCVCTWVYVCVHARIRVCILCIHVCTRVCLWEKVYTYMCMCVCLYAYVWKYLSIFAYVCELLFTCHGTDVHKNILLHTLTFACIVYSCKQRCPCFLQLFHVTKFSPMSLLRISRTKYDPRSFYIRRTKRPWGATSGRLEKETIGHGVFFLRFEVTRLIG